MIGRGGYYRKRVPGTRALLVRRFVMSYCHRRPAATCGVSPGSRGADDPLADRNGQVRRFFVLQQHYVIDKASTPAYRHRQTMRIRTLRNRTLPSDSCGMEASPVFPHRLPVPSSCHPSQFDKDLLSSESVLFSRGQEKVAVS